MFLETNFRLRLRVDELLTYFAEPEAGAAKHKTTVACFRDLVQWKPLNVITVDVISRL
jgi:hypothetical protein